MVEAGYRCAIPICAATVGLEVHHIVEVAKGGQDEFDNLILLCANCHSRVTKGEIDRPAVRMIKDNLGVLNHRYSESERRMMEHCRSWVQPPA
jgi:HNH endonuclease